MELVPTVKPELVQRKHPLAKCEECPLYARGKFVPSQFPVDKSNGVAFIGESPGREEKIKGVPFIGPSGRLLNTALEEHGIKRRESLLTNAALCNYKDEDKHHLPGAINACRDRLIDELSQANVTTAVTLGNAAVSSLLETKTGITKLRGGAAKVSTYVEGLSVIPTFHPAACLRRQDQTPLFLRDIGKLNSAAPTWVEPDVLVVTDTERALNLLKKSKTRYPLVVDTESAWEKDTSFTRNTNILCVGIGSTAPGHGNSVVVIGRPAIEDKRVHEALIRLIARVGLIGQNAKYDWHVLNALNTKQVDFYTVYDTMLASYSLHEVPGVHGLKYMSNEYLGTPHYEEEIQGYLKAPKDPPHIRQAALEFVRASLENGLVQFKSDVLNDIPEECYPEYDEEDKPNPTKQFLQGPVLRAAKELKVMEYKGKKGEKYATRIRWELPEEEALIAPPEADGTFASIPPELLHKYNAFDVQATRQLYYYFQSEQEREGLTRFNSHLVRMSNTLARVEGNGLTLDLDFNEELGHKFQSDIDQIRDRFSVNPSSPLQLKAHLKDAHGVEVAKTDKTTLKELEVHPKVKPATRQFASDVLAFRLAKKYKSTYVDALRNKALANDGRIFPSFVINQATTGRLASKNPNVQNMPRKYDIKKQFIPNTPGNVFVHADYSQLELRVITWLAQDEGMRALFNDPTRDVFDELTMVVHGYSQEAFDNLDPEYKKELRVVIKAFAYGIILDRSAAGIAMDPNMDITVKEAERQMNLFLDQIPGIAAFQKDVKRRVFAGEDLVNVFGRRRRFHLFTNQNRDELFRQAVAFYPQSTASDICVTAAGIMVDEGERVCNIIHDDILIEVEKERAHEVAQRLCKVMIETAETICENYVAFDVDAEWGYRWGEKNKFEVKDGIYQPL